MRGHPLHGGGGMGGQLLDAMGVWRGQLISSLIIIIIIIIIYIIIC